jgi:hypothetical protein
MTERELLVALKTARERLDAIKEAQKDAQACYDKAEADIVEALTANQAEATAKYDGIGYAKIMKPRVYASVRKDDEDQLKKLLRDKGRGDLVRETISAPCLSSYVAELVEAGKPIPDIISYYLKVSVRIF